MNVRALTLVAVFALSACAFGSERAFFADAEGAFPFADNARYVWRDSNSNDEQQVIYRRQGAGYAVVQAEDGGELQAIFVPVSETPEDDYIAQIAMASENEARLYAFLVPYAHGHLIITAPGALGARDALDAYCSARSPSDCSFESRDAILALYRDVIYPRFVRGGERPAVYMEQRAVSAP